MGSPWWNPSLLRASDLENDMDAVIQFKAKPSATTLFSSNRSTWVSVGVSNVKTALMLEGLMEAARFDRRILIERGINGREM